MEKSNNVFGDADIKSKERSRLEMVMWGNHHRDGVKSGRLAGRTVETGMRGGPPEEEEPVRRAGGKLGEQAVVEPRGGNTARRRE